MSAEQDWEKEDDERAQRYKHTRTSNYWNRITISDDVEQDGRCAARDAACATTCFLSHRRSESEPAGIGSATRHVSICTYLYALMERTRSRIVQVLTALAM